MKRSKGLLFLIVLMTVVSFVCLSLGTSYAFITQTRAGNVNMQLITSNMDFDVSYNYLDTMVSVSDDFSGIKNDEFGSVKVKNKSQYTSYMTLSLSYAKDDLPGGKSINEYGVFDIIPMEYVKVVVFGRTNTGQITQLTEPTIITENPILAGDADYQAVKYKICDNTISSNTTKEFYVKLWLDESIKNDPNYELYDEALLYLKLDVDLEPVRSKLSAALSGTITYNGSPVNATITNTTSNLSSSASGGNFTLSGFYERETYTIKVNYNNKDYYTTAHIDYNDVNSKAITPSEIHNGSYQNLALTYYTTVGQINRINPIVVGSNSNNSTCSNCRVPTSYIFKINDDTTIENLTLNLLDNGTIEIG